MYTYTFFFFFFKQKTAYEMRISDWSSDVCSSDLPAVGHHDLGRRIAIEFGNRSADRLVVEFDERAAPERLLVDIDALDDRRASARRRDLLPWRKDRERGGSRPPLPHPIPTDATFAALPAVDRTTVCERQRGLVRVGL